MYVVQTQNNQRRMKKWTIWNTLTYFRSTDGVDEFHVESFGLQGLSHFCWMIDFPALSTMAVFFMTSGPYYQTKAIQSVCLESWEKSDIVSTPFPCMKITEKLKKEITDIKGLLEGALPLVRPYHNEIFTKPYFWPKTPNLILAEGWRPPTIHGVNWWHFWQKFSDNSEQHSDPSIKSVRGQHL